MKNNTLIFNYKNFDGIEETYFPSKELIMRCTISNDFFTIKGKKYEVLYIYTGSDNVYNCYIVHDKKHCFMLQKDDFDFFKSNWDELIDICKNHKYL
jgi:hypothetical protein